MVQEGSRMGYTHTGMSGIECQSSVDECDLEFDDNPVWLEYQRERMKQIQNSVQRNFGDVYTAKGDAEILYLTTNHPGAIVHFYHPQYETCEILDQHLVQLAGKYTSIKWIRVSVLETPFLVSKLKIQVLPCVFVFLDGKIIDKMVGFDEVGGSSVFDTNILEIRLDKSRILRDSQEPV